MDPYGAWRCLVCGYVHEGGQPPETCPVCGAPASEFEGQEPAGAAASETKPATGRRAWRCMVCGYIHEGESPPDECPVCGASANEFEEIQTETPAPVSGSPAVGRIVIAGAGIAGLSAAEAVREAAPDAEIILLGAEEELPYYRLNLTRYLAGEFPDDDLPVHPEAWYADHGIDLRLGKRIRKLDRSDHRLELEDGRDMTYDRLIVATGAQPFIPPLPGVDLPHVFTLRTTGDAKILLEKARQSKQVVCIGGGILGLETAGALARQGANVTVLESFSHLMPRQLNPAGSDILVQHLYTLGIDVITQAETAKIESAKVELNDGSTLPADLVVLTVGVRADIGPFTTAGLDADKGLLVDDFMQTSDPSILAAGDACEHDGVMYGSWAAAQYQGTIAGMNAAGKATAFGGIPRSHLLKVLGKDMFSIGTIVPADGEGINLEDSHDGNYRLFVLQDGVLAGALLIGDLSLMADVRKGIENEVSLGSPSDAEEVARMLTGN